MTSRDFCYWLQGYFELAGGTVLTAKELTTVRRHLEMVFKHEIDPSFGDKKQVQALRDIHSGTLGDLKLMC